MNCLNEFVFPVSGKILLVNTNKPVDKDLSPEFAIQFNVSIIERAQRFVACQNKDFLEALIKNYKVYVQFKKTDSIITEMFDMLKEEKVRRRASEKSGNGKERTREKHFKL